MPLTTRAARNAFALFPVSMLTASLAVAAPSVDALVVDHAFQIHAVSPEGVIELAVDHEALQRVSTAQSVVIENFPASADLTHTFSLRPFELFTSTTSLSSAEYAGDRQLGRPNVTLLRGSVNDDPRSVAYLAISPNAVNGFFESAGRRFIIATGPNPGDDPVVYEPLKVSSLDQSADYPACGAEQLPEYHAALANFMRPSVERDAAAPLPRRMARIAIEADNEFAAMYASGEECLDYITVLFGAVSTVYHRELNIDLRLSHVKVWHNKTDPFTESVAQTQLSQFRLYYLANRQEVQRDVAHLLSQRAFTGAGGTAYLNGLCSDLGYGISGYLNGFFPHPLLDNQPQNWDPYVVTHELGHNFGAPHTHQMAPPIDTCGLGDCTDAAAGTIMSYCHTCSGALRNIAFTFHPRIRDERMIPFLSGVTCNLTAPASCLADFDGTNTVEGADLAFLLSRFFAPAPAPFTEGDLNGDSLVSGPDLSVFLRVFGQGCN